MSVLTITTTYDTAAILYESQLDAIKTPIETYFNTTQIEGSNIQDNILDGASYLADDSVSTDKLTSNAVTTAKLADSTPSSDTGITTAKINDLAVTTDKLDNLSVNTDKINNGDVTTNKLVNNSVPKGIMLAIPSGSSTIGDITLSVTSGSAVSDLLLSALTISGLTVGKPVIIALQSTSTTTGSGYVGFSLNNTDNYLTPALGALSLKINKDDVLSYNAPLFLGDVPDITIMHFKVPLSSFIYIDVATATSHTYKIYLSKPTTSQTGDLLISSAKLVAIQLV